MTQAKNILNINNIRKMRNICDLVKIGFASSKENIIYFFEDGSSLRYDRASKTFSLNEDKVEVIVNEYFTN